MIFRFRLTRVLVISFLLFLALGTESSSADFSGELDSFLEGHCYECHDDAVAKGELDFFSLGTDLSDPETFRKWERVFDRVKSGEMPPEKKPRPGNDAVSDFLTHLEKPLVAGHDTHHRETVLRRLNRSEYENTTRDLFGVEMRLAEQFPEDGRLNSFDTNGERLNLSTELIEIYLEVADGVFDRVMGPTKKPKRVKESAPFRKFVDPKGYDEKPRLLEVDEGTVVFGSNFATGAEMEEFDAPSAGTYRFRFHAKPYQSDKPVMMQVQTGRMTLTGKKRFQGYYEIPVDGRVIEVTDYLDRRESAFPRPFGTIKDICNFSRKKGIPLADYDGAGLLFTRVEIEGPLESWPPESRSRLLGDIDPETGTVGDLEKIMTNLLPRAFRRSVTEGEIARFVNGMRSLMDEGRSFHDALRWGFTAMLCSPGFLFIEELATSESSGRIDDIALANRLSYFLWRSMPDEELMTLAKTGRLSGADVLREQTARLLRDPKAAAFSKNFSRQWLHLGEIDATSPDTKLFRDFDNYLERSMVGESEHFFAEMLRGNHSLRDFIDSDWLMINRRLAEHYGIESDALRGEEFVRVSLPDDSVRGGVMTQASVLKITANGANTSPVNRGAFILEKLLGIHPPPPPPNIPAVTPDVTGASTLRELLAAHRESESCNSCHQKIDPPGFALESFDPIGQWRSEYRFQGSKKSLPVDATGVTEDGETFSGIRDYKRIMLDDMPQVTKGLAEKLLAYAVGREPGFSDRAAIAEIVATVTENDEGLRDLIHHIVQSPLFTQP